MQGESNCKKCGIRFAWKRAASQVIPEYCNMKCRGHTGFKPGGEFRISEASEEEKLERLKKSFEKHVIRKEGCWDWKGPIAHGGYPVMSCRRKMGSDRGHQASWIIHYGPIPKPMHVCHRCDNPICTNPEHLWLGTYKENNDDKISKGRQSKIMPPLKIGSENGSSKLSETQAKEIKMKLSKGFTCYGLGKEYGVSKTTIQRIKNGINWKHITLD